MNKIGCIVMYSKPIDKHKTIPCGTVYYVDGTEEEVSLKEAAEKALEMSLDYGYENAIENERYFNTTYAEFLENEEKYKKIANPNYKKEPRKMTFKTNNMPKRLSDNIREVEPPKVVKDETYKDDDFIKNAIDGELDKVEASAEEEKEKLDELIDNHQEEVNNSYTVLEQFFGESEIEKLTQEEKETLNKFLEQNLDKMYSALHSALTDPNQSITTEKLVERVLDDAEEKEKIIKIFDKIEPDIVFEESKDDIDYDMIEQKLNEVLDDITKDDSKEPEYTEDDLLKMINEQNMKVEGTEKKR